MGYNENRMKAITLKRTYDSDEDLTDDQVKQIKDKENEFDYTGADKVRKDSWQNAGMFPKLNKFVKDKISGDIREKTPEQDQAMEKELERRDRVKKNLIRSGRL